MSFRLCLQLPQPSAAVPDLIGSLAGESDRPYCWLFAKTKVLGLVGPVAVGFGRLNGKSS